jgi:thiamine-monophosphate kinase
VNAPASEFALIDRHFRRPVQHADVRVGIGDDAAVIAPAPGAELAVSVDMLVEGRHFVAGADPEALGHKALAVNLSDLAAMGARPRFALLAGALPEPDEAWLDAFMQGFRALAQRHDVELIGGDTASGPRNLCVTVIGELPAGAAITRAGARAGDDIYVSGTLGAAALAVAAARGDVALAEADRDRLRARLDRPEPRVGLGLGLRGAASAALDVSDGLTGDLAHILEASGCGATLELARLPADPAIAARLDGPDRALALRCLLAGGDDYELCFTAPAHLRASIAALAHALDVACTRVGVIDAGDALAVVDRDGAPLQPLPRAFDHFA